MGWSVPHASTNVLRSHVAPSAAPPRAPIGRLVVRRQPAAVGGAPEAAAVSPPPPPSSRPGALCAPPPSPAGHPPVPRPRAGDGGAA